MENTNKIDTSNPALSRNVLEMITVAHEYCVFLEKTENYKKIEIIEFINRVGSLIYLKGSLLPDVAVEYPEANERFVTEQTWEAIFNSLRKKLGKDDEFYTISRDIMSENQPLKTSLSELLADIYQDMKDFVYLYSKPGQAGKENAAHEIKQLYKSHWGLLALHAQTAAHHLLHSGEELIEEEQEELDFI
jgi:hypothetical protein